MELDEALKAACDGRALLFLGAGFSRGATNLAGEDYSLGKSFADILCKEAGLPLGLELDDAADLYIEKLGALPLIDKLKIAFSAKETAESHKRIASIPWRRVYTTNYDDVFELACSNTGKRVDSVVPPDDISKISKRNLICVHLNGFIRRTTADSVWDDVKLTQPSYDKGSALDTEWGSLFRADLQAAQAVFFVGYSLWDLDIRRVLFSEQLQDKAFFVLKDPDIATAQRVTRYGLAISVGSEEFAKQISDFQKTYVPSNDTRPISYSVVPYEVDVTSSRMEDRSVFELLLFGRLRPEFAAASCLGQVTYCGPRSASKLILSKIDSGTRVIVLHSALGNGKTIALEEVKFLARSKGYRVFSLASRGESLIEELQAAVIESGKKVFFVDNYAEWLDFFEVFRPFRSEDFTIVVSARSSTNDVLIDRLIENLGIGDVVEVPCDELSGEELDWIVGFFDEFGVWGEKASLSRESKASYLLSKCGDQWSGILIKLLESPHIVERLASLFASLSGQGAYREPIVQMLILAVLAFKPETPVLIDLCGSRILESGFRRDPVAVELVEFGRYSAGVRSSITAEALLRGVVDPNLSVNAYIALVKSADRIANESTYNRELLKSLVRYGNMQQTFAEGNRGRAAMRIYEAIKDLGHCNRSPQFWLQYAIAATVSRNFERAKSYFENAYSFARRLDRYDFFMIDNHYARFLVESAIDRGDATNAMDAFRDSRRLLVPQFAAERRHYPYRAATPWGALYARFRTDWPRSYKVEIQKAAMYVRDQINGLPPDRSSHRNVEECYREMQVILGDADSTTSEDLPASV